MKLIFQDNFHRLTIKKSGGRFILYDRGKYIFGDNQGQDIKKIYNQLVNYRNENSLPNKDSPPMKICYKCLKVINDGSLPYQETLCEKCGGIL